MKTIAVRLKPGDDLKEAVQELAVKRSVQAGIILSAVGSLNKVVLRMAGAEAGKQDIRTYTGEHEIIAITGTVSAHGSHIHLGVSNKDGQMIGGHLAKGCRIKTTCELVIGVLADAVFRREPDADTEFDELIVSEIPE
jgi:uncharacterized protein